MTIPNLITVLRLLLVPVIVWLLGAGHFTAAFWVFVAAGISDGIDGFLARSFDMGSELGGYLDPIADKALLVSIFVILAMIGEIPLWLTLMVVSRDILIVGGVLLAWMIGRPVAMRPLFISKFNTAAQIVYASVVVADLAFAFDLSGLRATGLVFVAVLTLLSAAAYLIDGLRHLTEDDDVSGDAQGDGGAGDHQSGNSGA